MILNDLFDSSDNEENNMLFPFPIVRNDDFYELHMLHPIFGLEERIEHARIIISNILLIIIITMIF